jgi:two-component system, OmpR family, response regulator MprA
VRLLVAEDDAKLCEVLIRGLRSAGYSVDVAARGDEAFDLLMSHAYDAAVVDWRMPAMDGIEVVSAARAHGLSLPVLMLTARDTPSDRIRGLDAGCDDYLVKPFDFDELLARVRALLRRAGEEDEQEGTLTFEDLRLDLLAHEAWRGERVLQLTRTEFLLLEMFLRHPRQVLTRSAIFEHVWGYDFGATSNSLGVYMGYLRRKTESGAEPRLLHTVRGVGYVLRGGS